MTKNTQNPNDLIFCCSYKTLLLFSHFYLKWPNNQMTWWTGTLSSGKQSFSCFNWKWQKNQMTWRPSTLSSGKQSLSSFNWKWPTTKKQKNDSIVCFSYKALVSFSHFFLKSPKNQMTWWPCTFFSQEFFLLLLVLM